MSEKGSLVNTAVAANCNIIAKCLSEKKTASSTVSVARRETGQEKMSHGQAWTTGPSLYRRLPLDILKASVTKNHRICDVLTAFLCFFSCERATRTSAKAPGS